MYTHLNYNKRLKLEALLKVKTQVKEIAYILSTNKATIYREIKRGMCKQLDTELKEYITYSAEIAQSKYEENLKAKGKPIKLGNNKKFADYIEKKIIYEKYSPEATLSELKTNGNPYNINISKTTLYRYINNNIFYTLNYKHLPYGRYKKQKNESKRLCYKNIMKRSIEDRPKHIDNREEFGHWEVDTVIGKRKDDIPCLLVLTERKTNYEIIRKIDNKEAKTVIKELKKIMKEYGKSVFKSITNDNGSEFAKNYEIENKKLKIYYCHPFCSCERGSNENGNKLIRRHIPKGSPIKEITKETVKRIEEWINSYPRPKHNNQNAYTLFVQYSQT